MGKLYIAEYPTLDRTEPPLAEQVVAIGGGSLQSAAFQKTTRAVRLHCDAICSVAFGTNPVATATHKPMAARQTEFFPVPQGQAFKVAVITNS
jgi:hypothetical protein